MQSENRQTLLARKPPRSFTPGLGAGAAGGRAGPHATPLRSGRVCYHEHVSHRNSDTEGRMEEEEEEGHQPGSGGEEAARTRERGAYHFPMRLGSMRRGKEKGRRGHPGAWPSPRWVPQSRAPPTAQCPGMGRPGPGPSSKRASCQGLNSEGVLCIWPRPGKWPQVMPPGP